MPGTFTMNSMSIPPVFLAAPIFVLRYTPDQGGGNPYALLPNVKCLQIDNKEGPEPPVARFQYIMDDTLEQIFGWPSQIEDIWPLNAPPSDNVVQSDDRLVVATLDDQGNTTFLFDGFAQIPQADLSQDSQTVTFTAISVAVRAWDYPITASWFRNSTANLLDEPNYISDTDNSDILTNIPPRFNPADNSVAGVGAYIPNATPTEASSVLQIKPNRFQPNGATFVYPVFLDPNVEIAPDPRTFWTISKAIRYILAVNNNTEQYVKNLNFLELQQTLATDFPAPGFQFVDPANPNSFQNFDVRIRDYDAMNKPWPVVVSDFLSYGGWVMRFDVSKGNDGNPITELKIYRRDEFNQTTPKQVYLEENLTKQMNPALNNVIHFHAARDSNQIVNAWYVETELKKIEVCCVLAPMFKPKAGDEVYEMRMKYFLSNPTNATLNLDDRRRYRWWGIDELAEGVWAYFTDGFPGGLWYTLDPGPGERREFPFLWDDLRARKLFPVDKNKNPTYVWRYRKVARHLISPGDPPPKDPADQVNVRVGTKATPKVLNAKLEVSFDYHEAIRTLYLQPHIPLTDHWYEITHGWQLLPDRFGIEITDEDPGVWNTGNQLVPELNAVWMLTATGDDIVPYNGDINKEIPHATWWLRLTAVIEADRGMEIFQDKLASSPTRFTRVRSMDGKDHFQHWSVDISSPYYTRNGGNGKDPWVSRDDTDAAKAHAAQIRSAHQHPPLAGSITIPYVTVYYEIGDRLNKIVGRDIDFFTNVGENQGEAPVYPWVIGVTHSLQSDRQQTILYLSDKRAEPQPWRG